MYIVTDPSLAAAVQRASKTMSFTPLVPDITQRVLGLDSDTVAIVRQHIDPEAGEPRGFLADMHDLVYSYLGPGEALNSLSLDAARKLAKQVEEYAGSIETTKEGEETVNLLQWVRHFVAIAIANLLYGDENPLALHPELESAFWDFDHGLGALLMGVFPSITARKAYRGREALVTAFEEYLSLERHLPGKGRKGASPMVGERIAIALKHGWTLRAAARSELSFLFAGIVNTATTTFWIVLHIFASASLPGTNNLLAAVRSELNSSLTPSPQAGTLSLSLDKLKTSSPTLQSVLRECLRQNSDTYSTRLVKSPTTLPSKSTPYHLAANAILQISGGTMHSDPRIWGPDVKEFNPLRFPSPVSFSARPNNPLQQRHDEGDEKQTIPLSSPTGPGGSDKPSTRGNTTTINRTATIASQNDTTPLQKSKTENSDKNKTTHPAAFRAFGGGKTLCPGRHFATLSIQALAALFVTKFDITGLPPDNYNRDNDTGGAVDGNRDGAGRIHVPGKEDGVLPVHVLEPRGEVRVTVRVRESRGVVVVV